MTGYDGSRASGYPPDLVPFRRPLGRRADFDRWGGLALQRSGEHFGNVPRSGGCANGKHLVPTGDDSPRRQAAPTRATLQHVQHDRATVLNLGS